MIEKRISAEERDVEAMAEIRARRWGTREFWIGPYLKGDVFAQGLKPTRYFLSLRHD